MERIFRRSGTVLLAVFTLFGFSNITAQTSTGGGVDIGGAVPVAVKCRASSGNCPGFTPTTTGDFALLVDVKPEDGECETNCTYTVTLALTVNDGNGHRPISLDSGATDTLIYDEWHPRGNDNIDWDGPDTGGIGDGESQTQITPTRPCGTTNDQNTWTISTKGKVSPSPFSNPGAPKAIVTASACVTLRCLACPTPVCKFGTQEATSPMDGLNDFQLYPNPSDGLVKLELYSDGPTGSQALQVYNLEGRFVRAVIFPPTTGGHQVFQLNMTELPAGQYIYFLESGTERTPAKRLQIVK